MKITIFTPTYNRAYILPQLYHSLQRQTSTDFEWLVVDDGSTDHTPELFEKWMNEANPFPIRYYAQPNGGKHRAINFAVTKAHGSLFFIVDSDDHLVDNAVETMNNQLDTFDYSIISNYAGLCNLKAYPDYSPLGTSFNGTFLDCTVLERETYGITGDKAEAFFTSVLLKYPFPEFDNETFLTEAVVWDRMAMDGLKLRFFNEIIYLCNYLEDGLTRMGLNLYYANPLGYGLYLKQCRNNHKFKPKVQQYFDVQCYLTWNKSMSIQQIAKLIGISPVKLLTNAVLYLIREKGSIIKHKMIGDKK